MTNPQSPIPNPCWYACVHLLPSAVNVNHREHRVHRESEPLVQDSVSSVASAVNVVHPLLALAEDFSPRYESGRDDLMVIDVSGLNRVFGDPRSIGEELRRSATSRGLRVQVAIAATQTAARVLAVARPGVTVIARGDERGALAPIAIGILERITDQPPSTPTHIDQPRSVASVRKHKGRPGGGVNGHLDQHSVASVLSVVKHWGLHTLGDLAALPPDELTARLGQQGLAWHTLARGQDVGPLVPMRADERFESSVDLEWPIEGLEPLSFVLTRLLEPLSTRLERRDRGAAVLHVTLGLVPTHDIQRKAGTGRAGGSGGAGGSGESSHPTDQPLVYTRSLQLPSPIRDVRTLRTLILLDLESHSPGAPIERVAVVIDPTPGRVLQHALFVRAHPTPEQLSTLIARLNALMGEDRVGRPSVVDSYRPGAFGMAPFPVHDDQRGDRGDPREIFGQNSASSAASALNVVSALRRCRRPVPARVSVADGRPAVVTTDRRGFAGGRVLGCAGPWRSSGHWWSGESGRSGRSGESGRAGRSGGEISKHSAHQTDPTHQSYLTCQTCWNRDEWEVSLSDGAVYRIFQDRVTEGWFIDAIVD
jgi:protein ImuB